MERRYDSASVEPMVPCHVLKRFRQPTRDASWRFQLDAEGCVTATHRATCTDAPTLPCSFYPEPGSVGALPVGSSWVPGPGDPMEPVFSSFSVGIFLGGPPPTGWGCCPRVTCSISTEKGKSVYYVVLLVRVLLRRARVCIMSCYLFADLDLSSSLFSKLISCICLMRSSLSTGGLRCNFPPRRPPCLMALLPLRACIAHAAPSPAWGSCQWRLLR
jgi:hypothetical protein